MMGIFYYFTSCVTLSYLIIYAGLKLLYLHAARGLNIRIIDLANFLAMPLAHFPKVFQL